MKSAVKDAGAPAEKRARPASGRVGARLGNQAMLRMLRANNPPRGCSSCGDATPCSNCGASPIVAVGASHDTQERTADAFARDLAAARSTPRLDGGPQGEAESFVSSDVLPSGTGAPLEATTRERLEQASGHDLGGVRVHTDHDAARSAAALGARAYTLGQDIVFGAGEYRPHSHDGFQVLAHETAHAIQSGGVVRREDAAAPRATPPDAGPCAIVTDQLSNEELLFQLNRSRLYLTMHRRGEGEYYDYANLLRRLLDTRGERVVLGHVWLAEPGLLHVPEQLYRLRPGQAALELLVEQATGAGASGRPTGMGDTLLTPAQFQRFLEREGVETMDPATYFATRDPDSTDPLRVQLPPRPRRVYVPLWSLEGLALSSAAPSTPFGPSLSPLTDPFRSYLQVPTFPRAAPFGAQPFGSGPSPFEQAFGMREETYTPNTAATLMDLNMSPGSVVSSGPERVYMPAHAETPESSSLAPVPWADDTDAPDYSAVPGATPFSLFAQPAVPLASGSTGILWEGSHVSDFVVLDGRFFIRGFRASLPMHGISGLERSMMRGGAGATAALNRGTPGSYANDAIFPYMGGAVAIVRADGTAVDAEELARLMQRTTVALDGATYRYSTPPVDHPSYQRAFGGEPAGFCPPGASNCINLPMDVHDVALGGHDVVLPDAEGRVIDLADPAHASAPNMNRYVDLPDEFFASRGLRRVPLTGAMWRRTGVSAGFGAGTALLGNLWEGSQSRETHYVRDISIGAGTGAGTTVVENYVVNAATQRLIAGGMAPGAAGTVGRLGAGSGIAVLAAPIVTTGSMALSEIFSDADYTSIDYAAAGGRSLVGASGGALAAGVTGAVLGSEVPILGNAVGFIAGVGGYFATDWLFGEDVEDAIRRRLGEYGCRGTGR
jgi:hypothetical protein